MQKDILACMDELTELLNELNWKWWKNEKPLDPDAINGELVDVLHFFVSMCIRSGMSAQDLFDGYIAKNKENFDRQYGRSKKTGYEVTANGTELPRD
jgi:dimeric dUTPase (all-alpha-NTP-PPase superfamily)